MDKKICFIVLHYNTINETIQCVESIRKLTRVNEKVHIVIVDNSSPNGTGRIISDKFNTADDISVILLNENTGFSRGNNAGYISLKEKYDFVIFANNDLIFKQKDFLQKIESIYEETEYAVLCPDVLAYKRHEHQSPIVLERLNLRDTDISINNFKKRFEIFSDNKIPDNKVIQQEYWLSRHRIMSILKDKWDCVIGFLIDAVHPNPKYSVRHENMMPMGACLIFSNKYFDSFRLPFWPETYFYNEESVLAYNCERKGLRLLYDPSIRVLHVDHASTYEQYSDYIKTGVFRNKNLVDSLVLYRKLLTDGESAFPTEKEVIEAIKKQIDFTN